jgi:hypothetical protein
LEFKNWVLKKGVQELGIEKRYSKFQCTFLVHALYIPCT